MTVPARDTKAFALKEARQMLAATPPLLETWLRLVPPEWTLSNEGGESWSAFDVVGHLIHGEQTDWIPRVRHILTHGEDAPFARFDRFAQFKEFQGRTLDELLAEFAASRADSLAALDELNLSETDLARRGMHPRLGVVTLRQLLATWVAHDLDHVMQIARVMGFQYRDEVGPWRRYLRVISGQPSEP